MITVNFFSALRSALKNKQVRIYADEISVINLLKACETQTTKPLIEILLDEDEKLLPGTMILVNGQNVRQLHGVDTIVRNGSDVALFSKT